MKSWLAWVVLWFPLSVFAANISIVNQDGAGEGLNDPTPATPVGGNTGTTVGAQRLLVFQRAAALWGARLVTPVTIQVGAKFDPLSCSEFSGTLGSAGPHTFFRDFSGAPRTGTYYPVALANALAGSDLDPANVDIDATFNSDVGQTGCLTSLHWYYGLDGSAPPGSLDLLGVILHEMAHGLGFVSSVNLATGARLNGFNDCYILNLEDHASGKLYPSMTDAERLAASVNNGNLHWVGSNVVAAAGFLTGGRHASGHVQMYAPNPAQPGSSVSHFDVTVTPDELMEPFDHAEMDRRLTEQLLRDVGWTVLPPIQTNGQALLSESCPSGQLDPGETVTVSLTLRNVGPRDLTDLVAILQATNGVTDPSSPQSYGPMTVLGSNVTRTFSFTASGDCGSLARLVLRLQDGTVDYGEVSFTFPLGGTRVFASTNAVTIPSSGPASQYPATITVSNYFGPAQNVAVRLANLNHSNPDDLDVLLVGPEGQKVLLMSDAGGTPNLVNVTLTFADNAAAPLPDATVITSGTWRPANYETAADAFSSPAPAAPYATNLSVFDGTNPNGVWQLYVLDDRAGTSGSLAGGWAILLPECCGGATNTLPSLAGLPDQTFLEDNSSGLIPILVSDLETPAGSLSVWAESSNLNLVPASGVVVSGVGSNRFLQLHPRTNESGQAGITVWVSDGALTNSTTFLVTVLPVNDPPFISPFASLTIPEDGASDWIAFTLNDVETPADDLIIQVAGTNSLLLGLNGIELGGGGTTRALRIHPATNQFGQDWLTVSVSDGASTNTVSFLLTVSPVNDPPQVSGPGEQLALEDAGPVELSFSVSDPDDAPGGLLVWASSDNNQLLPPGSLSVAGTGAERTLSFRPATNQFGTAWIEIWVSDGALSNQVGFRLTVNAVNDTPVLAGLGDRPIPENSSNVLVEFVVEDVDSPLESLHLEVASTNESLVPSSGVVFGGSGTNRWLIFTPVEDQTGEALLTISVSDGAATNSASFLISIFRSNAAPTIEALMDLSSPVGVAIPLVTLRLADADDPATVLSVSVTSDNPLLLPETQMVVLGAGFERQLILEPLPGQSGQAGITVSVTDGLATNWAGFTLMVTNLDQPPLLSGLTNQIIREDAGVVSIEFTVADDLVASSNLVTWAVASNLTLLPPGALNIGGDGATRTLNWQTASNAFGTTEIVVFLSDGVFTNQAAFTLEVLPVNDSPTLGAISDQTILANSGAQSIALAGLSAGPSNEAQVLSLQVRIEPPGLLEPPMVSYVSPSEMAELTLTPLLNARGTALVEVVVLDDGGTAWGGTDAMTNSFSIRIMPVADLSLTGKGEVVGSNLVFTLSLSNLGPHSATGIRITNLMAPGLSLLSVEPPFGDSGAVELSAFAATNWVWNYSAAAPVHYTNSWTALGAEMDPDLDNNALRVGLLAAGSGDFDGDGLPDAWEYATGTDPFTADSAADPDGDGASQLQEFLAGTEPRDGLSVFRLEQMTGGSGGQDIVGFLAVSNRTYELQFSTNLTEPTWVNVLAVPARPETVRVWFTNHFETNATRFYRVSIPAAR